MGPNENGGSSSLTGRSNYGTVKIKKIMFEHLNIMYHIIYSGNN